MEAKATYDEYKEFAKPLLKDLNMNEVSKAFIEYGTDTENLSQFLARMINEYCRILNERKEDIEKEAEYIDVPLRPLQMSVEISECRRTEHLDYNSAYPDCDRSEKDCMWEDRE